jgi:hypothetical protein
MACLFCRSEENLKTSMKSAERDFLRALGKNHPMLTPTEKNWLESGEIPEKFVPIEVLLQTNCEIGISTCSSPSRRVLTALG